MLHSIPNRCRRGLAVSALAIIALASSVHAQTAFFQSGNGPVDGPDALITFEAGPAGSDFGPLQPSDFLAAMLGTPAYILSPAEVSPYWAQPTAVSPTAQWVGTSATAGQITSTTALYAVPFYMSGALSNAFLNITFSVDDQLGGKGISPTDPNMGMYIDGNPISGSASNVDWFGPVENYTLALGSLSMGTHYLFLDDNNSGGGPAGVIFSANVVPEPAPLAALGIGALGLLRLRRRR